MGIANIEQYIPNTNKISLIFVLKTRHNSMTSFTIKIWLTKTLKKCCLSHWKYQYCEGCRGNRSLKLCYKIWYISIRFIISNNLMNINKMKKNKLKVSLVSFLCFRTSFLMLLWCNLMMMVHSEIISRIVYEFGFHANLFLIFTTFISRHNN